MSVFAQDVYVWQSSKSSEGDIIIKLEDFLGNIVSLLCGSIMFYYMYLPSVKHSDKMTMVFGSYNC